MVNEIIVLLLYILYVYRLVASYVKYTIHDIGKYQNTKCI